MGANVWDDIVITRQMGFYVFYVCNTIKWAILIATGFGIFFFQRTNRGGWMLVMAMKGRADLRGNWTTYYWPATVMRSRFHFSALACAACILEDSGGQEGAHSREFLGTENLSTNLVL